MELEEMAGDQNLASWADLLSLAFYLNNSITLICTLVI
jgi:hypothetical protein